MSVKPVQNRSTRFATSPSLPSQKGPRLRLLRPFARRRVTGMAYEMYNRTIHAVTILLELFSSVSYLSKIRRECVGRKAPTC